MTTSTTPSRTDAARDAATEAPVAIVEPALETRPLETRAWLQERISSTTAATVGVAWYALFMISSALEPRTSHDVPVIGVVIGAALLGAMLATAIGLAMSRRWGLVAAVGASGLLLAATVACPTTGHHTIGAWWFAQMACALAAAGVSVVALRRA